MKQTITHEVLASFAESCAKDPAVKAVQASAARNDLNTLLFLPQEAARLNGPFTYEIKTHGITAQMKSGRCWMFAVMNLMREKVMEKTGLTYFELSNNYLAFYDKLEKSNNALQYAIDTAHLPLDSRECEYLLEMFHDGGFWQMAVDLVNKYGIVPLSVMPESYGSTHTSSFQDILNKMLRKDFAVLRTMVQEGKDPYAAKEEMLKEIYRLECMTFGTPVQTFDLTYTDKDGSLVCDRDLTPKSFYNKYIGISTDDYVCVNSEITHKKPIGTHYSFHYIGNMYESNVKAINVSPADFEELCVKSIRSGTPFWFCNDCDWYMDRQTGVFDPCSFAYRELLGVDLAMDRTTRLEYKAGFSSHAMLMVGVNMDRNGAPDRWKIENSWGAEPGNSGYFVCSEAYFKEYVYEAVILKKYLTEEQLLLLNTAPIVLKPWEI